MYGLADRIYTMFTKEQLIDYITLLGSAESLYMTGSDVRTMCMGSHRCELFFGSLRRLSNFHHTS